MNQPKINYLPPFNIPGYIRNEMTDWLSGLFHSIPEYNVTEKVSEWAERKRSIGKGLTANPGPYDFSLTPYLIEIVDCLSDSDPTLEIYVTKGTQVGFTVGVLENHIGFCVEYGIGPLLYVGADQAMAEEAMEKRVDEMIYSSGLQGKIRTNIKKKNGKATGDRTDSKAYGGTFMRAIGPNSEGKARSFPARIVHLDEMSNYPLKIMKNGSAVGDIIQKIIRRQDTYGPLRKTVGGSTPLLAGSSRIDEYCELGDKCYYQVRCPKCDTQQPLIWANLKWDKDKDGNPDIQYEIVNGVSTIKKDPTFFECINDECKYRMKDEDKLDLLKPISRGGSACWVPTKKPSRPFVRSFHIPAWLGMRSWMDIIIEWNEVKDDPFKLQDFINNIMGEVWTENEHKPDDHHLMQLSQEYEQWHMGFIKKEVIFLTMAVDIQGDRIEAGLMGWGRNKQGYMIDYWTFEGNPSEVENKCWQGLSEKINAKYVREDGYEMNIQYCFIDSQYLTDTVDLFCDSFPYSENGLYGVFPLLSRESMDKNVKTFKGNIKTPTVGIFDQGFKRALYNILRKRPHGPGAFPGYYLHFSMDYGKEFYKQLTSEEIETIKIRGVVKGIKILNTRQRRNEVLDIVKMNLAAFQFAMDRYFNQLNEYLKLQKKKPLQEDSELFFDHIEEQLFD